MSFTPSVAAPTIAHQIGHGRGTGRRFGPRRAASRFGIPTDLLLEHDVSRVPRFFPALGALIATGLASASPFAAASSMQVLEWVLTRVASENGSAAAASAAHDLEYARVEPQQP